MASSALRSALRSTACMQAVDLKKILRRRLADLRRRSVGSCGATRGAPRPGRGATSLYGPSNWPSGGEVWVAASSWRASRTCANASAKALRWDILRSRSPADWRWSMVASSSAMSQSIVSSIIGRPRRITGIAGCRAINSDAGAAVTGAAALPASLNSGAPSPNGPPRSQAERCPATGKPTSCCSPDMARDCWFCMNDKPASASFGARAIGKPSAPLRPSPVNSANFHRRCAKPSASTTEPSSPSIIGFTKRSASRPSSAIPIVPGKRAVWKTPSAVCDAHCHAKPISSHSPKPTSSGPFNVLTTPLANAWTSRPPPRHSPNSYQPLHFKRESTSPPSRGRQTLMLRHHAPFRDDRFAHLPGILSAGDFIDLHRDFLADESLQLRGLRLAVGDDLECFRPGLEIAKSVWRRQSARFADQLIGVDALALLGPAHPHGVEL